MIFKKTINVGSVLRGVVAGMMAMAIGVAAMTTMQTVASAAENKEEIVYLDNYEVKKVTSGKGFNFRDNEENSNYWAKVVLKSDTVVSVSTTAPADGQTFGLYVYSMSDSTTTKERLGTYTAGDMMNGINIKLNKGTYAFKFTDAFITSYAKNDATYTITWKEKATTAVKSLKVYMPIKKGSKFSLAAVTNPTGANITYTTSNSKILTVTSKGTVKAVGKGKAHITIKADKKVVKLYYNVI